MISWLWDLAKKVVAWIALGLAAILGLGLLAKLVERLTTPPRRNAEYHDKFEALHEVSGKDLHDQLNVMTGKRFREWCAHQFACRGADVALGTGHASGVGLVAQWGPTGQAVLCSQRASKITGPEIERLLDLVVENDDVTGMVITTSYLTGPAQKLAVANRIELVTKDNLPEFAERTRRTWEDRKAASQPEGLIEKYRRIGVNA